MLITFTSRYYLRIIKAIGYQARLKIFKLDFENHLHRLLCVSRLPAYQAQKWTEKDTDNAVCFEWNPLWVPVGKLNDWLEEAAFPMKTNEGKSRSSRISLKRQSYIPLREKLRWTCKTYLHLSARLFHWKTEKLEQYFISKITYEIIILWSRPKCDILVMKLRIKSALLYLAKRTANSK